MKYLAFSKKQNVRCASKGSFRSNFKTALKTQAFLTKCSDILSHMITEENINVPLTSTFLNYPFALGDEIPCEREPQMGSLNCYKIVGKSKYASYIMLYLLSDKMYNKDKHILMLLRNKDHYSAGLYNKSTQSIFLLDPFLDQKSSVEFINSASICDPESTNINLKQFGLQVDEFDNIVEQQLGNVKLSDNLGKTMNLKKINSMPYIHLSKVGNAWVIGFRCKSLGNNRIRKTFPLNELGDALEYRDLNILKLELPKCALYYPAKYFSEEDVNKFKIAVEKKYITHADVDTVFTIDDIDSLRGIIRAGKGKVKAQLGFDNYIYYSQIYDDDDIMKTIEERDLMCLKILEMYDKTNKTIFLPEKYNEAQLIEYKLPLGELRSRKK